MYGWRARIGRVAPSNAAVSEEEWRKVLPDGVIICASRMLVEIATRDGIRSMMENFDRAAKEIASAGVDIIIQTGTPGVFVQGLGADQKIIDRIRELTGVKATTMMTSVVLALRELGIRKLVVVNPYVDELNEDLKAFLNGSGFQVVSIRGLGMTDPIAIGKLPPTASYRIAKDAWADATDEPDGTFISCGNFRTFEILSTLEKDTGKPATSSSQATLWNALRMCNVREPISGYGTLLERL